MANRIGDSGMGDAEDLNRSSGDTSDDSAVGQDRENIRGVGDAGDEEEEFEDDEFEDTDDLDEEDEADESI